MKGRFTALILAGALAGCGGGGTTTGAVVFLRPDIVLLSVSGHGSLPCLFNTNVSYLDDAGDAVQSLEATFASLGLTTQAWHYADLFDEGAPGNLDRQGFLQLLDRLDTVFRDWIDGVPNPTRIVIVAHSHGTNWAHTAASIRPNIPIEYLITLDGICFTWECEHAATIDAWVQQNMPFPHDISEACNVWIVPGQALLFNIKDVAFDNVIFNLEVQSSSLLTTDCCDNYRLDGTTTGIATHQSTDDHRGVHVANGDAMNWVDGMIRALEP